MYSIGWLIKSLAELWERDSKVFNFCLSSRTEQLTEIKAAVYWIPLIGIRAVPFTISTSDQYYSYVD